jgi:hypothetical protein
MQKPNVQYQLIEKWSGVDYEFELDIASDGCVIEVTHVAFVSNNGYTSRIAEGAISSIDGCQFEIEAIFAHPESGCAWAYAREYMGTQYVKIGIDEYLCYSGDGSIPVEGIVPSKHTIIPTGWVEFSEIKREDLPF